MNQPLPKKPILPDILVNLDAAINNVCADGIASNNKIISGAIEKGARGFTNIAVYAREIIDLERIKNSSTSGFFGANSVDSEELNIPDKRDLLELYFFLKEGDSALSLGPLKSHTSLQFQVVIDNKKMTISQIFSECTEIESVLKGYYKKIVEFDKKNNPSEMDKDFTGDIDRDLEKLKIHHLGQAVSKISAVGGIGDVFGQLRDLESKLLSMDSVQDRGFKTGDFVWRLLGYRQDSRGNFK